MNELKNADIVKDWSKSSECVKLTLLPSNDGRFKNAEDAGRAPVHRHSVFRDLEELMYIRVDPDVVAYVSENLVKFWGVDVQDVWSAAYSNTKRDIRIMPLGDMMKLLSDEFGDVLDARVPIYFVSSDESLGSGGAITALDQMYEIFPKGFTVLPSSRHEVLVVDNSFDYQNMVAMVTSINRECVSECDRLTDDVYRFEAKR